MAPWGKDTFESQRLWVSVTDCTSSVTSPVHCGMECPSMITSVPEYSSSQSARSSYLRPLYRTIVIYPSQYHPVAVRTVNAARAVGFRTKGLPGTGLYHIQGTSIQYIPCLS